jgi:hypothetical protein
MLTKYIPFSFFRPFPDFVFGNQEYVKHFAQIQGSRLLTNELGTVPKKKKERKKDEKERQF